jgi:alanine racemase
MISSSTIILDEQALKHNWDFLRQYFGHDIQISAVVKGNAYGHGIDEYVPLAERCGVNHFSVYNAGEAHRVFEVANAGTTIMIMGAMDPDDILWAVENSIEFFVFDSYRLEAAKEASLKCGKKALVHVEVETGMYRSGFDVTQIPWVIDFLRHHAGQITFRGLCMHFAGAESISNHVRLKDQKAIFKKVHSKFKRAGLEPEQVHTCCSAAAIRFPEMRYDMLRIGIMQYGFWPTLEIMVEYMNKKQKVNDTPVPLQRIIRWVSNVMSVKNVPQGAYIGYGYSFLAQRAMKIAIVPVGYAHGFSRSLSNTGFVLINNYRVPVIGTVNMNCVALDISMAGEVATGDEVVLIGKQGHQEISVASFGEMTNLLNYELLTRLPSHIPRIVNSL